MRRRHRAFTILELLTVIAILGLLMAILVPSLSSARRSAKTNVCLSHLKGIGNSFVVYLNENEDFFPPVRLEHPNASSDQIYVNEAGRGRPRWQWFLETDQGPVVDPTPFRWVTGQPGGFFDDNTPARGPSATSPRAVRVELFTCPALDDDAFARDVRDGAYGYNYQYLGNTRTDSTSGRWDNFAVGLHRIRNPGQTIVVGDSRGAGRRHGKHSFTLDPPRLGTEVGARRFGPVYQEGDLDPQEDYVELGSDPEVFAYSPVEARHNDRGNVVFADAHAETRSLSELGYQMNASGLAQGVPKNTPIPVTRPDEGTYEAQNRFFNGEGSDRIAEEHRPGGG